MNIHVSSPRFLIRSSRANETQAYGHINELFRLDPQETYQDWVEWNNRGAIQLFIVQRGLRDPRLTALAVPEGTVIGFIKIVAQTNEVSFVTHPQFRGRGAMREAAAAAFRDFFRQRPKQALLVKTRSNNWTVIHMMEAYSLGSGASGQWSDVGSVEWRFGQAQFRG